MLALLQIVVVVVIVLFVIVVGILPLFAKHFNDTLGDEITEHD